jgi:hypothetical protein
MVPIKAVLTGLFGVSICLANISGVVTDTGSTPISGAVVKLENAGWTATTGTDGSFKLSASTGEKNNGFTLFLLFKLCA